MRQVKLKDILVVNFEYYGVKPGTYVVTQILDNEKVEVLSTRKNAVTKHYLYKDDLEKDIYDKSYEEVRDMIKRNKNSLILFNLHSPRVLYYS